MISETQKRATELRRSRPIIDLSTNIEIFESYLIDLTKFVNELKLWHLIEVLRYCHDKKFFGAMEEPQVPAVDNEKG